MLLSRKKPLSAPFFALSLNLKWNCLDLASPVISQSPFFVMQPQQKSSTQPSRMAATLLYSRPQRKLVCLCERPKSHCCFWGRDPNPGSERERKRPEKPAQYGRGEKRENSHRDMLHYLHGKRLGERNMKHHNLGPCKFYKKSQHLLCTKSPGNA